MKKLPAISAGTALALTGILYGVYRFAFDSPNQTQNDDLHVAITPQMTERAKKIRSMIEEGKPVEMNCHFCGKNYSEYQRMRFERKLDTYLSQLEGYVIYKYQIQSVKAFKNVHHKGTVTLKAFFDVWPVNCLDRCHVEKEVDI